MVGIVSPWVDADSDNAVLRRDSASALRQELQWAAHLSLQACSDLDSVRSDVHRQSCAPQWPSLCRCGRSYRKAFSLDIMCLDIDLPRCDASLMHPRLTYVPDCSQSLEPYDIVILVNTQGHIEAGKSDPRPIL